MFSFLFVCFFVVAVSKDNKLVELCDRTSAKGVTKEKADYFRILAKFSVEIVILWAFTTKKERKEARYNRKL